MAAMNMNQEQFKQLIREEKPVLVDFWAPWCSYCRRIGPAYEKIGEEYADSLRFLYKGIIIKHNKTEPTYTKTSLFLCEKRRFFMARTEKGVVATI